MSYESKCFAYYGPGDVRLETREVACGPTDILLRIDVCGRCGTDRRLFRQSHPAVRTPTVLGHELVGRVVEVGGDVKSLTKGVGYMEGSKLRPERLCPEIGQRVTVQSRIARYRDGLMLMRDPIENLSFQIPGAFAQYMRVTETMIRSGSILPIDLEVSDEEGALVEPTACALESVYATPHAVGVDEEGRHVMRGGVKKGGRALIIGSGTLAMVYARLALIEEAAEVWLLVRSQAKNDLVRGVLGDEVRVRIVEDYSKLPIPEKLETEEKIKEEFRELTNGDLFDDIVLAAPSLDAQRLLFHLLNPDGYAVGACFAGLHAPSELAQVDLLHYRMGKAVGTSGCSTRTMETVLKWLSSGKLSLKNFTCPRRFTLDDDPEEFFQTNADGRKPMLYP